MKGDSQGVYSKMFAWVFKKPKKNKTKKEQQLLLSDLKNFHVSLKKQKGLHLR